MNYVIPVLIACLYDHTKSVFLAWTEDISHTLTSWLTQHPANQYVVHSWYTNYELLWICGFTKYHRKPRTQSSPSCTICAMFASDMIRSGQPYSLYWHLENRLSICSNVPLLSITMPYVDIIFALDGKAWAMHRSRSVPSGGLVYLVSM